MQVVANIFINNDLLVVYNFFNTLGCGIKAYYKTNPIFDASSKIISLHYLLITYYEDRQNKKEVEIQADKITLYCERIIKYCKTYDIKDKNILNYFVLWKTFGEYYLDKINIKAFVSLLEDKDNKKENNFPYTGDMFVFLYKSYIHKKVDEWKEFNYFIDKLVRIEFENINSKLNSQDIQSRFLYHYVSLTNYSIDDICQNTLYLSSSKSFNDPTDPLIKVLSDYPSEFFFDKYTKKIRISCLSTSYDNLLMWSHYADKHQGICIAYEVEKIIEFLQKEKSTYTLKSVEYMKQVQYNANKRSFQFSNKGKTFKFLDLYCTKHENWKYEDEYRLLTTTIYSDQDSNYITIPIKRIYLGAKISSKNKEMLKRIVNSRDIELYEMDFLKNNYIFELKEKQIK